nr:IS1634 family transposase [Thermus tengchongensis]
MGEGITPDLLNDDRMGRMLDSLYAAGVTELFVEVAKSARRAFPFPVRALHVDSTSFHVHGVYGSGEEGQTDTGDEPLVIRLTHGYSRDHRPDLKQWVMNLICADTGGFPCSSLLGMGTSRIRRPWFPCWRATARAWNWGRWWCWTGPATARRTWGPCVGSPGSCGCRPP